MKTVVTLAASCLLLGTPSALAQDPPTEPKVKTDPKSVSDAVGAACRFLLSSGNGQDGFSHGKRGPTEVPQGYGELILYTVLQSGHAQEGDPAIAPLVRHCMEREISSTYTASLGAMAFQKLNPRAYQARIAAYAQFLCDNQSENGQWDYGAPIPEVVEPKSDVARPSKAPPKKKAELPGKSAIRKRLPGPPHGDNGNSQVAALGLRACLDAGLDIDPKVLQAARGWWTRSQNADGGWGYNEEGKKGGEDNPSGPSNTSYGSMTAGAVSALQIYAFYAGGNPKTDPAATRGIQWLAKNYDVVKNPKKTRFGSLFYLWALERAGAMSGSDRIGSWEWYQNGAEFLMGSMKPGAYWNAGDTLPRGAVADTCFAVLFLARATAPLQKVVLPAGGESGPAAPLVGAQGPVEAVAPGWRLLNVTAKGAQLLGAARGKNNVLITPPPNLKTFPTLRRRLAVGAATTRLKVVVGHHESSHWTLRVKADDVEIHKASVAPPAAADGWLEVTVDLSKFAGKEAVIELVAEPGGQGTDVAYWAEVAVLDR